jgi:hypothetical protein
VNDELERGRILQAQHLAAAAAAHRDRRERIATAAMAGILSDHTASDNAEHIAWVAVQYADALIEELDKPKEVKP